MCHNNRYNAVHSYSTSFFLSIQKMESVETETGDTKNFLSHYYYINYKVFVNVVKYKLDRMREKIQAEERRVSFIPSPYVWE